MKVCYIFREKERNGHSIELLFDAISDDVANRGVEVLKWYKPLSNFKAIFSILKLKADVYHITGDCYFMSLFLPWNKTVMTIHDIGMYKNHKITLKKRFFALLSFIIPLKLLKYSTVISSLTKSDLIQFFDVDRKKLELIPNPLILPITYSSKKFNKEKPVILQIGSGPHKNLLGLIEAAKDITCRLDIVGRPDTDLLERLHDYDIEHSISSNISTKEVIEKYRNCDILFFASHSEGFGLPILEAQAMGRAVITSNSQPTAWVGGKGVALVDPNSVIDIRNNIMNIIENDNYRISLISEGQENIKRFTISEISEQYIELYNKVLNH